MIRGGGGREMKNELTPHEEHDEIKTQHTQIHDDLTLTGRPPVHLPLEVESGEWLVPRIPIGEERRYHGDP